jgi:poly(beta-D-mannuronate) lyase
VVRLFAAIPLALLLAPGLAQAEPATLVSPFAHRVHHFSPIALSEPAAVCPRPPAVEHNVMGLTFYTDKQRSIPNTEREKLNGAVVKYGRDFIDGVDRFADAAALHGDAHAGRCALAWMENWAAGHAFEGKSNQQGKFERKWRLTGLALVYMKLHDTGLVTAQNSEPVLAWLTRLVALVKPAYDDMSTSYSKNNHAYWAGSGLAALGIATNNHALFDWGMARYRMGVDSVTSDGVLKSEIWRGQRALHYHLFALTPLVMLAEMGEVNGIDTYAMDHAALRRLVDRSLYGVAHPDWFSKKAGTLQDINAKYKLRPDEIAWTEQYQARFPTTALVPLLRARRPIILWRDGGNLTGLYDTSLAVR